MDWATATMPTKLHVTLVPPAKPDPDLGGLEATDGAPFPCLQSLFTGMWTSVLTSALETPSLRLSDAFALMLNTGSALFVVWYADSLGDVLARYPAATDLSITSAWSPARTRLDTCSMSGAWLGGRKAVCRSSLVRKHLYDFTCVVVLVCLDTADGAVLL